MNNEAIRQDGDPTQTSKTNAETGNRTIFKSAPAIFITKKKIWKWLFLVFASYVLVTIFHSSWVPAEMATRGLMRMVSPTLGALYGNGSRDRISLALFQDEDLDTFGERAWPAKYAFHADNLRSITALRPEAIFVDLLFVDKREDDLLPLVEAICQAKEAGIKLYLASPSSGSSLGAVLKEITQSGCATLVSVPRLDDQFDQMLWEYGPETGNKIEMSTAATRIARDLGIKQLPVVGEKLAIIWGTAAAPHNLQTLPKAFCAESSFMQAVKTSIPAIIGEKKPYCPFHPLVRISDLRLNAADAQIANLVQGKIVIYGSNMAGSADKVKTALNERLPGPFVHAMALDNFLTFGEGWKRSGHYSFLPREGYSTLFLIVALFVVCGWQVLVGNKDAVKTWILYHVPLSKTFDVGSRIKALAIANSSNRRKTSILRKTGNAIGGLLLRTGTGFVVFAIGLPAAFLVACFGYHCFSLAPSMWLTIALFPPLLEQLEFFESFVQPVIDDFNDVQSKSE